LAAAGPDGAAFADRAAVRVQARSSTPLAYLDRLPWLASIRFGARDHLTGGRYRAGRARASRLRIECRVRLARLGRRFAVLRLGSRLATTVHVLARRIVKVTHSLILSIFVIVLFKTCARSIVAPSSRLPVIDAKTNECGDSN
jgi:hypothetical protein